MYSQPAMDNRNYLKKGSTVTDKKLAHHLQALTSASKASAIKSYEHDNLLLPQTTGIMEVEDEMERTWRIKQNEIVENAAIGVQGKAFSLKLDDFGPYDVDYTRNGRYASIFHNFLNNVDAHISLHDAR
jgi:U3 small nucleolar RNA-associated protein 7